MRYVNLGRVVALTNRDLAYDNMHLTPPGNMIVAEHFVTPMLEMARQSQ